MKIRIIDLETGADLPEVAVCEIGWTDLVSRGVDLAGGPTDWEVVPGDAILTNPGCPIDPRTSAVHHIIDEDVRDAPAFVDVIRRVVDNDFREVDEQPIALLAAHNTRTERAYLDDLGLPLDWICTYRCALRLWPEAPSHSNGALRYWRRPAGLDRARSLPAHRAGPDSYVTAFHLREMLEAGSSIDDLVKWSNEPALLPKCKIGKWRNDGKGTPWEEVDDGFLWWMLDKDFDEDSLHTARHHLNVREEEERRERERWEAEQAQAAATMRSDPFPEHDQEPLL